jgi:uncharacterized phage-like protein YoqJ
MIKLGEAIRNKLYSALSLVDYSKKSNRRDRWKQKIFRYLVYKRYSVEDVLGILTAFDEDHSDAKKFINQADKQRLAEEKKFGRGFYERNYHAAKRR